MGHCPMRSWLSLSQLIWLSAFRCQPMETLDPLLLSMFVLGAASTLTVFVVAFRQVDRTEKDRAKLNRMRGRLNRLLKLRS